MKRLFLAVLLSYSTVSHACKFSGLDGAPVFEPGKSVLSAEEILRFGKWRATIREAFPNGGGYVVVVPVSPQAGVSEALAKQRMHWLVTFLLRVGVPEKEIWAAETWPLRGDPADQTERQRLANTAAVEMSPSINSRPGCQCCPA